MSDLTRGTQGDAPDAGATAANSRPLVSRPRAIIIHASLVLFALAIITRAGQLQLLETTRWTVEAEKQQVKEQDVVPPRGPIVDAKGNVFVETREVMRLQFAPHQIKAPKKRKGKRGEQDANPRAAVRQGLKALGVHDTVIRKVMDTTRKWVEIKETFVPSDLERFASLPGVRRKRELKRTVTAPPGIRGFLGAVRSETTAVGGIEAELDSLLRGVSGRDARVVDGKGNLLETPALSGYAARPGHSVSLTINRSLQEIAERALADGITRTGATGGDVVMMDPRDGSVLAMVGVRNREASVTATALAEPYEPGSVMKPFIISRAIDVKRVSPDDLINTEGGTWTVAKRKITDEHKAAFMSVRDVVRLSSNIGAAKIALKLSQREEYETLRDFGFGTLTGLPYPAESRGQLKSEWLPQTPASVAIGYEISATPMQIAAAYVAIANGGELLQPAVVREVLDADGRVVFTHERRVIRRVLSPETARLMREMLASVVDSGTAVAADMATYDVGGKSGTARRVEGKRYALGKYNSSFAGMFPVQAPQYVIVVRLIDPEGKIYGGTVSGTVVNEILQASIAARDASLDRRALAAVAKPIPTRPVRARSPHEVLAAFRDSMRFDSLRADAPPPLAPIAAPQRVVVALPLSSSQGKSGRGDVSPRKELRTVPSVYGLDARQAVRTLHAAGFHVKVAAGGATRTRPAAGTLAASGSVVVLETAK